MTEELEFSRCRWTARGRGIAYMVTGSFATNYYAVPRMTRDIDLVVELSVGDADRFCALFEGDFYLDRDVVRAAIIGRGAFNLIHLAHVVKVDCIVRKDSEYRRMEFARQRRGVIEGHQIALVAPEERLKMGCSMGATARVLVRASVLAQEPHASPAALRRALFLRFYGHEFHAVEREKILLRLGQDEPRPAGSTKRVPVNWDDLEMALTSNHGEWTCYLDLETGEVRMVPMDRLDDDDDGLSEDEIDAGLEAGRLIHVEPLGSKVEYRWMEEFTRTVRDVRLRDRLEVALDRRGAFRRFKNVLLDFPAERERWFALRDERLHAAARDWLGELRIEPTTVPQASR